MLFPDELYSEWYRLYKLPKPLKNKPWKFKHLTVEHIYWPLAKSSGKVYQLTQALRRARKRKVGFRLWRARQLVPARRAVQMRFRW